MKIVEDLKKIRESKKITREKLAQQMCISTGTLRDIEYGKIRLSLENYLLMCQLLEISPMLLLNQNDDEVFVLLNKKDIQSLNELADKISRQSNFNTKIKTNINLGVININNSNRK